MANIKITHNGQTFTGKQIKSCKIIEETDPLSIALISSTADIVIDAGDMEVEFVKNVPFKIYHNDKLKIVTYLDEIIKQGKNSFKISTIDIISWLEQVEFYGNVYEDKNVKDLIAEICEKAGVLSSYTDTEKTVTGLIKYSNCREALNQVLFASGSLFKRSFLDDEEIISPVSYDEVVSSAHKIVPKTRILQGQTTDSAEDITGIKLTTYNYKIVETNSAINYINFERKSATETLTGYLEAKPEKPAYDIYVNASSGFDVEMISETATYIKLKYTIQPFESIFKKYITVNSYGYYEETQNTAIIGQKSVGKTALIEGKQLANPENSGEFIHSFQAKRDHVAWAKQWHDIREFKK